MTRFFQIQYLQIQVLLACGILLSGCGIAPPPGTTRLAPTPIALAAGIPLPVNDFNKNDLDEPVPVFIVSSRNIEQKPKGIDPFGNHRNRGETPNLAIAQVRVGKGLTADQIAEETVSVKRRKKARVVMEKVDVYPTISNHDPWKLKDEHKRHFDNPWINELRTQLDRGKSRQVVVFVHGYNTHLTTNTEQSAEIFHYLGREGAIVNFEWPSQGKLVGYIQDKGNAEQSTRLFRGMISNIAKEVDASSITVIAHSAGNPIVVNALKELRLLEYDKSPAYLREKYRINRVILAAPDMDVMAFFNAVFDRFHEMASGVAVYASPDDQALKVSSLLFGDSRLGRSIGELETWEKQVLHGLKEIEMIDVARPERLYSTPLGHLYFYQNPWVSSDIGTFMFGKTPEYRGLVPSDDGIFWEFPEDYVARQKARAEQYQ